ncbi:MAG: ABC transporter ATP-binding protein [Ignavibacteriae bacterium]|nr:ABC transporter ATP-binding protein [Ignavibacteriota bacterium]MCB9206599.1 ABC transporter ATP-binding protein [Ignavibacteriales bacterium]MCB9209687.1 ABC transporter ATP-binding protein [Ignavibacteriales bacterium]MCB9218843.1 ABC transporter ATP-binding protein [Ignavibacteriales bacterium]
MKEILKAQKISKVYQDQVGYRINLLHDINFNICENEFVTILAPIGSGKTSLLKIIADLDKPTSGIVESELNQRIYIPSKPSSFPWLNVEENISFNSNLSSEEIQNIIDEIGLHGYEYHFPNNKSEGFRFRISLGRALANNPEVIILDEPFNNLNTATRKEIYTLVKTISKKTNVPFLLGTTNITEAIFLSDKIYLMKKNPGEILEVVNVELPKKRDIEIIESDEFLSIRNKIEDILKEKTSKVLYNFSI